ncbi:MAG: protein kinase domain-containing protein [Ilumatobacteraceae bacterium]
MGAKYYKVTEKVAAAGLEAADVAALDLQTQLVLLKTVAHSLKILHDLNIVHSDLKPSNVLIKRTDFGFTTKLIDFDSSYLAGRPPPRRRSSAPSTTTRPSSSATSRKQASRPNSWAPPRTCSPSA